MNLCHCGSQEIVYSMVFGPFHHFDGAEIGRSHSRDKCGWGYECQDCWDMPSHHNSGGLRLHFPTRHDAVSALANHLMMYCRPNLEAMTDEERSRANQQRRLYENLAHDRRSPAPR